MGIHFRCAPAIAVIGVLALGGASVARAQDTSAAARQDTSGYQKYGKDTSQYHGAPTDTALKAKPGVQTGPAAKDSGAAKGGMGMSAMDTVVCKDGSNAANTGKGACGSHGGVDSAATKAAMKARGMQGKMDSSGYKDSSSHRSP